jgi:hypothetical protein
MPPESPARPTTSARSATSPTARRSTSPRPRSTSRIEGIRITNTAAGKDQPPIGSKIGAGILVFGSSPTITRNEIVGNTIASPTYKIYYGAGIYINGVDPQNPPRPIITNNLIQGNVANPQKGRSTI